MKPGTYTMTSEFFISHLGQMAKCLMLIVYKSELAVATATVTISAGQTITANIKSAEATPSVIWQLGEFDGTPRGFLNAE
jgi:rhamnogalacturonan endolyase